MLTVGYGETGRLGHGDEEDVVQPKVTIGPICFVVCRGSQGVHVLVVVSCFGLVGTSSKQVHSDEKDAVQPAVVITSLCFLFLTDNQSVHFAIVVSPFG